MSAAACARRAALFVCLLAAARAGATSWTTDVRSLQKVADGVWVIIHKDAVLAGWPQGNTTVVIGRRGVLVVDACFLTSSAREDIADIRRLTSKPVRWLVNTHFHIDHNAGNSAYKDAFPGVEIIAQSATRRFMDDTNPAFAANVIAPDGRPSTELLPAMRRALASGHDDGGNALSAADRALRCARSTTSRARSPTIATIATSRRRSCSSARSPSISAIARSWSSTSGAATRPATPACGCRASACWRREIC